MFSFKHDSALWVLLFIQTRGFLFISMYIWPDLFQKQKSLILPLFGFLLSGFYPQLLCPFLSDPRTPAGGKI
jgi:hypothetical protein